MTPKQKAQKLTRLKQSLLSNQTRLREYENLEHQMAQRAFRALNRCIALEESIKFLRYI